MATEKFRRRENRDPDPHMSLPPRYLYTSPISEGHLGPTGTTKGGKSVVKERITLTGVHQGA